MDKFKALSLVLLGMVIGLGYAVACGSGDDDEATTIPAIPGVGLAMAQNAGCTQWETVRVFPDNQEGVGTVEVTTSTGGLDDRTVHRVPAGWTPLSGSGSDLLWLVRCAQ